MSFWGSLMIPKRDTLRSRSTPLYCFARERTGRYRQTLYSYQINVACRTHTLFLCEVSVRPFVLPTWLSKEAALHKSWLTVQGNVLYMPRAVMFDLSGSLGGEHVFVGCLNICTDT